MKVGLLVSGRRSSKEAVALARAADRSGVDELWISEDYFENGAFALAGAIANTIEHCDLGIGVVNPWTRHPVLTAMEFAAVQGLAPGRPILGLGASNRHWMEEQCGIPFKSPLSALDEAVTIARRALSGERVIFGGRHFRVDARLSAPLAEDTRIFLGVKGPRMVALAGQIADGVVLSLLSSPDYVRWVREQLPAEVEIATYVLAASGPMARADVRRPLAFYLGVHGEHEITRMAGLPSARARRFRDAWVRGDVAIDDVTDDVIDQFAIAGDIEHCCAGLDQLADAGIDSAILLDPGDNGVDQLLELAQKYQAR
jgi:5,10-methylenetetrahydromethanopterin reductase